MVATGRRRRAQIRNQARRRQAMRKRRKGRGLHYIRTHRAHTPVYNPYHPNWIRRLFLALPSIVLFVILAAWLANVRKQVRLGSMPGILDLISLSLGSFAVLFGVFGLFGTCFGETSSFHFERASSYFCLLSLVLYTEASGNDGINGGLNTTMIVLMICSVGFALMALIKVEFRFDSLASKMLKKKMNDETSQKSGDDCIAIASAPAAPLAVPGAPASGDYYVAM